MSEVISPKSIEKYPGNSEIHGPTMLCLKVCKGLVPTASRSEMFEGRRRKGKDCDTAEGRVLVEMGSTLHHGSRD